MISTSRLCIEILARGGHEMKYVRFCVVYSFFSDCDLSYELSDLISVNYPMYLD